MYKNSLCQCQHGDSYEWSISNSGPLRLTDSGWLPAHGFPWWSPIQGLTGGRHWVTSEHATELALVATASIKSVGVSCDLDYLLITDVTTPTGIRFFFSLNDVEAAHKLFKLSKLSLNYLASYYWRVMNRSVLNERRQSCSILPHLY